MYKANINRHEDRNSNKTVEEISTVSQSERKVTFHPSAQNIHSSVVFMRDFLISNIWRASTNLRSIYQVTILYENRKQSQE